MAHYQLCYGRVSTEEQSLELQMQQFQQQLEFDELFAENLSGRRRDRPEFLRMVERALDLRGQRHLVTVWVIEWTRWARDTVYSMESLAQLEAAGVQVKELTTGQEITLQTASGLLTTGVKSLMAHYYSVELGERIQRAYAQMRRQGRPMCGPPPFGYQRSPDGSRYEPGPEWAKARAAVEHYMQHGNVAGLSVYMEQEHGFYKSRAGWRWWLRSAALRGHLHYAKTNEWRYNTHPALITEEEYKRIEYLISLNRQLRGNNQGRIHAVPPIVSCVCGCRCRALIRRGHRYFACAAKADYHDRECSYTRSCRQDAIEAAIQEALVEAAEAIAADMLQPSTVNPQAIALERELEALRPLAHRAAIAEEIAAIEAELNSLAGMESHASANQQELREKTMAIAQADLNLLPVVRRREIYAELVERVILQGNEVAEVRLKLIANKQPSDSGL
jgi:DNA invertase Pin-like site-specific DNA recombinase